jgi:hypothetical protein
MYVQVTFGFEAFEGRQRDKGLFSEHILRPMKQRPGSPNLSTSDHHDHVRRTASERQKNDYNSRFRFSQPPIQMKFAVGSVAF